MSKEFETPVDRSAGPKVAVILSALLIGMALIALPFWLMKQVPDNEGMMRIEGEVVDLDRRGSGGEVTYTYEYEGTKYCSGEYVSTYEGDVAVQRCEGGPRVSDTSYREISRIHPLPILIDPENPENSRVVEPPYSFTWMFLLGTLFLAVAVQQWIAARSMS